MSNRTDKVIEGCIAIPVSMVANGIYALFGGWMLMLAVGIAHAEWVPALPTIGYWWAALIVWLLQGSFKVIEVGKS